jgi:hypothetical protein
MTTHSTADTVPVRLAAERLHRLDIQSAWGRLEFTRAAGQRRHYDVRHAAARRELVLNLAAARTATLA